MKLSLPAICSLCGWRTHREPRLSLDGSRPDEDGLYGKCRHCGGHMYGLAYWRELIRIQRDEIRRVQTKYRQEVTP